MKKKEEKKRKTSSAVQLSTLEFKPNASRSILSRPETKWLRNKSIELPGIVNRRT